MPILRERDNPGLPSSPTPPQVLSFPATTQQSNKNPSGPIGPVLLVFSVPGDTTIVHLDLKLREELSHLSHQKEGRQREEQGSYEAGSAKQDRKRQS